MARVGTTLYPYRPRSDFLLLLGKCPFLLIEVCSDRVGERDRFWMLLQAGVLVRVMNSYKQKPESFIAVAIYINSKFTAERYLVGQPQKKGDVSAPPIFDSGHFGSNILSFADQICHG